MQIEYADHAATTTSDSSMAGTGAAESRGPLARRTIQRTAMRQTRGATESQALRDEEQTPRMRKRGRAAADRRYTAAGPSEHTWRNANETAPSDNQPAR